ncbi:MAG: hypothetical protein ACRCXT_07215 [Paraclostridium sp.]
MLILSGLTLLLIYLALGYLYKKFKRGVKYKVKGRYPKCVKKSRLKPIRTKVGVLRRKVITTSKYKKRFV